MTGEVEVVAWRETLLSEIVSDPNLPPMAKVALEALRAECETVCNSYVEENQRLSDRAEALRADNERLEKERDEARGKAEAYDACVSVARKQLANIKPEVEAEIPALCEITEETWRLHKEKMPICALDMLNHAERKLAARHAAEASLAGRDAEIAKAVAEERERVVGHLFLLCQAIEAGDPKRELLFRIDEIARAQEPRS